MRHELAACRPAALERCLDEVVTDILEIVENCSPDQAQMQLVMRGKNFGDK
jgi:hypothetical protein